MSCVLLANALCIGPTAQAGCSEEKKRKVVSEIRELFFKDLLFASVDMKDNERVNQQIQSNGNFPSWQKLVENGAKPCFGSWPRGVVGSVPFITFDLYRTRRAHWAHGGWQRALAQLQDDGFGISGGVIQHEFSAESKVSIAKVVGEKNAVTASTLYQYLDDRRKGLTLDFPKCGSFYEVLRFAGLEEHGDRLPVMGQAGGIKITKQIIQEGFAGIVISNIRFAPKEVFKAMAKRATGFPYSKYTYLNWITRKYSYNMTKLFGDVGYTLEQIKKRREQFLLASCSEFPAQRKLCPPMTDQRGLLITQQIIDERFEGIVMRRVINAPVRSFRAMARRATGFPYGRGTYGNWLSRRYKNNSTNLFRQLGYSREDIKRMQEDKTPNPTGQWEWNEQFGRMLNIAGQSDTTPVDQLVTQEGETELFDAIADAITLIESDEDKELAAMVVRAFTTGGGLDAPWTFLGMDTEVEDSDVLRVLLGLRQGLSERMPLECWVGVLQA